MNVQHRFPPHKQFLLGGLIVVLFLAASLRAADAPLQLKPEDMKWAVSPAMHGLMTAVLTGNPAVAGPYVERMIIPPNARLQPHKHPNEGRMVTVLSGTIYFAFGDRFDETKLVKLPTGSFFMEPANTAHYSMTKEDGVVLELHAIGPAGTTYVEAVQTSGAAMSKASQEIEGLLAYMTGLKDAVFIRNGTDYNSTDAAAHLRRKWEMQAGQIKSAEDFITLCATKSSMSGQAYVIKLPDGKSVDAATVLSGQLRSLRTKISEQK